MAGLSFDDREKVHRRRSIDVWKAQSRLRALTVLGSVYLLGVSAFRFLSYGICSSGGCPDDGPWGGGWGNQTVAVLVVLATIAMVVAARAAARMEGRRYIHDGVRNTAWFAGFTAVLFTVPYFV